MSTSQNILMYFVCDDIAPTHGKYKLLSPEGIVEGFVILPKGAHFPPSTSSAHCYELCVAL